VEKPGDNEGPGKNVRKNPYQVDEVRLGFCIIGEGEEGGAEGGGEALSPFLCWYVQPMDQEETRYEYALRVEQGSRCVANYVGYEC